MNKKLIILIISIVASILLLVIGNFLGTAENENIIEGSWFAWLIGFVILVLIIFTILWMIIGEFESCVITSN